MMIKRTIEISREPAGVHLAVRDNQLLVLRRDAREVARRLPAHPENLAGSIPCEDIGVVMVDSRDTTYSHHALASLAEHGAAVVICGRNHHPVGMYVPLSTNSILLSRLSDQLRASRPTRKRLWAEIVAAKIRAQAFALAPSSQHDAVRKRLGKLAASVRSGDPENAEAQAAQAYWPELFARSSLVTAPFRRRSGDQDAPVPNALLDYGYAALRAAVARALVSAGFLPAIGIEHHSRNNPFCLADDLMEPLRPMVDLRVRQLAERGDVESLTLSQETKAYLLGVLTDTAQCGETTGPLQVTLTRYIASFAAVLAGESETLAVPRPLGMPASSQARGRARRSANVKPDEKPPCRSDETEDG